MTATEAKQVLRTLLAGFPRAELDQDAVILWANAIARFPLDIAMLAAGRLIQSEEFFPSLARFIVECQAQTRRVSETVAAPELTEGREARNAVGLAGVARARAELRRHPLPFPDWDAAEEPVAS